VEKESEVRLSGPSRCRQNLEAGLPEMPIGRKGVRQARLAHDDEARAVRERIILVAVLKEQLARFVKPRGVDMLPPEVRTSIDLMPPFFRDVHPEPDAKERERFIDNEIGRHEKLACFKRGVASCARAHVIRIIPIDTRDPSGRVYEEAGHFPYSTLS
jgi:hypothetical protein